MTGLYGTMAYAAQQRSREIGLRIALGATPRQATALARPQGLTLAVIGTILGLAGSVGVARALIALLFGVGVNDPVTFIAAPAAARRRRRAGVLSPREAGAARRSHRGDQR